MSNPSILDYPGARYLYNLQAGVDADEYATQDAFTGATDDAAGKKGLVPAPAIADKDKFLKGDGTFGTPTDTTYSAFTGATGDADGAAGLVPAPEQSADVKVLCSDGTWKTLAELS
jgi:hypothetical protein